MGGIGWMGRLTFNYFPHHSGSAASAVEPVDGDTVALHVAEIGHLTFRKATDVAEKPFKHLVVATFAQQVASEMSVFETVAFQPLGVNATVNQTLNLVDHAFFQPLPQATFNATDDDLTREGDGINTMLHFRHDNMVVGIALRVFLYFQCTHKSVAALCVGVVVEFDQRRQPARQLLIADIGNAGAENLVNGGVGQRKAAHHSVDIEPRATTEDRLAPSSDNGLKSPNKIVLELVDIVLIARFVDVDEMDRNRTPPFIVFGEVLASADVHAAEHLARVGTDDFAAEGTCHSHC